MGHLIPTFNVNVEQNSNVIKMSKRIWDAAFFMVAEETQFYIW